MCNFKCSVSALSIKSAVQPHFICLLGGVLMLGWFSIYDQPLHAIGEVPYHQLLFLLGYHIVNQNYIIYSEC